MNAHEYRDDDDGYRSWMNKNPGGYVINIQRSHNSSDAHLHDASCHTLTGQLPLDVSLTGPYVKVCGEALSAVLDWAAQHVGEQIQPCGFCRDSGGSGDGPNPRGPNLCPTCNCELPVTGKCYSCGED